jgi:glutaredoxin
MKQPNVTVYGSKKCPDSTRSLRFLDARQIPYEFIDLDESPELNAFVADLNHGERRIPTIRIDNEILITPSDAELGRAVQQAAAERD